jgi:AcrR family transcriptional regulator
MGIIERKQKEKERRRHEILKAAHKVFLREGYNNSSMDLIAEEAQLSKGTLYLYYKTKDDLYASVLLEKGLPTLIKFLKEADSKTNSIEDKILNFSLAYYRYAVNYPEFFNMLNELHSEGTLNLSNIKPETLQSLRKIEEDIFKDKLMTFQKGIETGIFNDDFSTCYALTQLWLALTGTIQLLLSIHKSDMFKNLNPEDVVTDLTKVFIMAYSNSKPLINKFRKDIFNNSRKQAPTHLVDELHHIKLEV